MELPDARLKLVQAELRRVQAAIDRSLGARERVQHQLTSARTRLTELAEEVEVLEMTQALALALEGVYRQAFEQRVSDTISEGLTLVFAEGMELRIVGSTKNGQSAADFVLETGDIESNVMDGEGGSVVQVVSFLMRVLFTLSHTPQLRHTVCLDELFGGVSEQNIPAVALLLRKLVDESGMQILLATHNPSFIDIADIVHEVKKERGVGRVETLKAHGKDHLYDEVEA